MSLWRTREMQSTVRLEVDGRTVLAEAGEPVAIAIGVAGRTLLARSVKYHRPRGAVCYEGRCDGCLMRVDGVPNVMTCQTPARDGMKVETQNVLGSADADLLSVTDWFFPGGLDHHRMFTKFATINRAMQKVARRIAGIGRLPEEVGVAVPVRQEKADVVVVGAGLAGLTAARSLAEAGADTVLVEEDDALGGTSRYLPADTGAISRVNANDALPSKLRVRLETSVIGYYDGQVGLHDGEALTVLAAKAVVIATGTHESMPAIVGSDLPGVIGARAAARLLARGIVPGKVVAFVGQGQVARGLADACSRAGAKVQGPFPAARVARVEGRTRAHGLELMDEGKETHVDADAVVLCGEPSASFELAGQAGANVVWVDNQFRVEADPRCGRTAVANVFAVGSATGVTDAEACATQAKGAAQAVLEVLRGA